MADIREFVKDTLEQTPSHLKDEMNIFLKALVSYLESNPTPRDGERDMGELACSIELEEYLHTIGFPSLTH